jgi:hypothetical protein
LFEIGCAEVVDSTLLNFIYAMLVPAAFEFSRKENIHYLKRL